MESSLSKGNKDRHLIQEKLYSLFNPCYNVKDEELPMNKIEKKIQDEEGP